MDGSLHCQAINCPEVYAYRGTKAATEWGARTRNWGIGDRFIHCPTHAGRGRVMPPKGPLEGQEALFDDILPTVVKKKSRPSKREMS
jgi:hypothetical protein